jgi:hypothetical protein
MRQLFLIFCVCIGTLTFGQDKIKSMDKTMSLGSKNAYYVELSGSDQKNTEKAWEDYIKAYGKSKYNKKAKEYYLSDIKIPMVNSGSNLGLYTVIEGNKTQSTVYTWYDMGNGFANPKDYAAQEAGIKTFLNDFWIFARKRVVAEELATEEKKQKDFEKDLSKLEGKNKDLHDDIAKLKEKIRQAEADIEKNLVDQDNKKVEIKMQQKTVEKTVEKLNMVGKETEVKKM